MTPSVIHAMQIRRLFLFAGCILAAFGGLAYRLVDLQIFRHEFFAEKARINTEVRVVRKPTRGDIRDARGNLLAASKIVHNVCADPHVLSTNYFAVALQIAPVLGMTVEELAGKIRPRWISRPGTNAPVPLQYVSIKKQVEDEDWERVREAMRRVNFGIDESKLNPTQRAWYDRIRRSGIYSKPDELRYYPSGSLAAHLLGFVGMRDVTNETGRVVLIRGQEGLEKELDEALVGSSGWRQTATDIRRREMVPFREHDAAPRSGLHAVLTLDSGIQHIVEDELAAACEKHTPVSVSCIVVRPKTGEIVAMASLPNFDPNEPGNATPEQRRNRVIADIAEPGSTFKTMVVAAALNEGIVSLQDPFDCENGIFFYAGKPLRDDHQFDVLTVEKIIAKSSNIGAAKIGILLGKDRLYRYVRDFGFGEETGIGLEGEQRGIFREPKKWNGLSITRIPMGHEVACTPLQMVMAMAAVANGGVLMQPMILSRLVDDSGETVLKNEPREVRRVISREAAAKVVQALKTAVSTNGTGAKAQLTYYTAAGKTGTAQKIVNRQYVRNRHYSSFIGFFPADDPQLCISVVFDEPKKGYYGSETGAPVFQRVAERAANYLAIPPEKIPTSTLAVSNLLPAGRAAPRRAN